MQPQYSNLRFNDSMRKLIYVFLFLFCTSALTQAQGVRIFIAGDSTAQTYDENKTLMRGWGQMLPQFFTEQVEVINRAKAGRSTKSFIDEKRWEGILTDLRKGDWVIVQFAHNDTSSKPERHASPADFKANLLRFINDTRVRGANILLLTPIVMRTFNEQGNLVDDRLKNYPGIIRQLAQEESVPLIDINLQTRDLILTLGNESSKELYYWVKPGEDTSKPDGAKDDTHMREVGALKVAQMVAKGMWQMKLTGLYTSIRLK